MEADEGMRAQELAEWIDNDLYEARMKANAGELQRAALLARGAAAMLQMLEDVMEKET